MTTGVSTFGQAINLIDRLKIQQTELNSLSDQLASGKKTSVFSGLGNNVITSQRARADFSALDLYNNNITNAERRIELMLNAIEEFQAQAENFSAALVGFSQESTHQDGDIIYYDDPLTAEIENIPVGQTRGTPDEDAQTLQDMAANLYEFMISLLNTQDGDRYLMGGSEALLRPIEDTGLLDAAVSTALFNWKNEGGAGQITTQQLIADMRDRTATAANPDAITDTILGFNAQLSSNTAGKVFVRVDDEAEVNYTALANEDPFRDIMVALSYFKSDSLWPMADTYAEPYAAGDPVLTDPETGQPLRGAPGATLDEMKANFYEVFNEIARMVNNALDDIDAVRYRLENAKAQIVQVRQDHKLQQSVLEETISNIEDADINEVAVRLNYIQIQLDASYRVTARIQELSLVNFI